MTYPHNSLGMIHENKEGVLLRKVSPSLGLSDHFFGCGILNYRSDRDWS